MFHKVHVHSSALGIAYLTRSVRIREVNVSELDSAPDLMRQQSLATSQWGTVRIHCNVLEYSRPRAQPLYHLTK